MKYFFIMITLSLALACQSENKPSNTDIATSAKREIPIMDAAPVELRIIKPYICKEGGFSIVFPDSPTINTRKIQAQIGQIKLTQLMYEKEKKQAWLASYSDYPAQMMELSNPKQLLKGIRNQVLDGLGTKAQDEMHIVLGKYDGLSFSAYSQRQKMDILYRIYLVKNRVYQLGMFSSVGSFSAKDSSEFMGSFQLLTTQKDTLNPS